MPDGSLILAEMFGRADHPRAADGTGVRRRDRRRTRTASPPGRTARSSCATTAAPSRRSTSVACSSRGRSTRSATTAGGSSASTPTGRCTTSTPTAPAARCGRRTTSCSTPTAASTSPTTASSTATLAPATSARSTTPVRRFGHPRGRPSRRVAERHRPQRPTARPCTTPRRSPDDLPTACRRARRARRRQSVRRVDAACARSRAAVPRLARRRRRGQGVRRNAAQRRDHGACPRTASRSSTISTGDPMTTNICFGGDGAAHGLRHALGHRSSRHARLAPAGAPAEPTSNAGPRRGPSVAWSRCRNASTSRPWAARRTRSTPTSSSARCSPTAWPPPTTRPPPTWSWSTRARSSTPPARSRSTRSSPSTSSARPAPRLVVTGCMAERYGDELAEALPEVDQVAGFGVPRRAVDGGTAPTRKLIPVSSAPLPTLDLLNLPRPRRPSRGPTSRSPRAATARAGSAPSRRSAARSAAATSASILDEVDQLGVAERSCSSPRTSPSYGKDRPGELGAGSIVPLVRAVAERVRPGAPAVPLSERSQRRPHRRDLRHGRAVLRPVAAARQQAAAAAHAPLGRRRPLPAPHRRHPRPRAGRRVPQQLHRRLPGRDRGRPRPAARLRRGGPARLVRVLRLQPRRTAPTPSGSTGSCRTR